MRLQRLFCVIASWLLTLEAPAQIHVITAPSGTPLSSVSISRNGAWIAGTSGRSLYRWEANAQQPTLLGTMESGILSLSKNAISQDGSTIAVNSTISSSQGGYTIALRWRGDFRSISTTHGILFASAPASDMSSDGNTIFGNGPTQLGGRHAWVSSNGNQAQSIISVYGGSAGVYPVSPPSVTASGSTAIWHEVRPQAVSYLWRRTAALQAVVNGVRWSAISSDGSTLAGLDLSNNFLTWNTVSGVPISHGTLASSPSVHQIVRSSGLVLGSGTSFGTWIWTPSTGVTSLLQYASVSGVDMAGWSNLTNVRAADDGLRFVGLGTWNGQQVPFVLTVPSPSALSGLAAWGLAATPRRRR